MTIEEQLKKTERERDSYERRLDAIHSAIIRDLVQRIEPRMNRHPMTVVQHAGAIIVRIGEAMACQFEDGDDLVEAVKELVRERDEARREADRFRHGCTVEGDFVCPNEYVASELTAERNFLRALKKNHDEDFARVCKERDEAQEAYREARASRWHVSKKWDEALKEIERLRTENRDMSRALTDAIEIQHNACTDAYRRGAEAMRARCEELVKHNSHEDGIGMGSQRIESAIRALTISEET